MLKRVFESPRPVSRSALWDLLVDYYCESGPYPWRGGKRTHPILGFGGGGALSHQRIGTPRLGLPSQFDFSSTMET